MITSKTHQTVALPKPLIKELKRVAAANRRSLTNTVELILVQILREAPAMLGLDLTAGRSK